MRRLPAVILITGLLLGAGMMAAAQSGLPAEIADYTKWTKVNATLMVDLNNRRAGGGPKNTYTNLQPEQLREIVAPGGRVRRLFPDGTIFVRETLDADAGFVRLVVAQKKDPRETRTRGWIFSSFFGRSAATEPFTERPLRDPVAQCLNCHGQVRASDFVFTPWTNRPDPLPARIPAQPDRVEIFNYQFGPQTLRVKAGATVVFVNHDLVVHSVKAADLSFESGNMPLFDRVFFAFQRPGTFEYFCSVHLEMRGRVVVEP
jgi:plastocyanin